MLLAKHFLDKKTYQEALAKGVNTFLYNETDFALPQTTEGIIFFNCTTQRVPSTWFTWKKNEELLLSFKAKFPQFFQWGDYDMTLAFQKALYWSNQRTGFLHYAKEVFFKEEKVFRQDPLHPVKVWKVLLKYFASKIRTGKNTTSKPKQEHSQNIGIYIRNEFQISLYKKILAEAAKNEGFVVFVSNENLIDRIKENGIEANRVLVCSEEYSKKVPLANLLAMSRNDLFVLNQLLAHWQEVAGWIGVAEYIIGKNIGKLLINEGENGVFGAIMGEVMNKRGVITYNTMNGMKSGQAQDSFINFDYWFVWDKQMKRMLVEKNHLNPDMLLVSGHLMEDEVRDYTYQNSIGINPVSLEGKKVISLFSVRGKREEKIETFQYLYNLAEENSDIFLLVRPHPSEKNDDSLLPPTHLKNVQWIEYNPSNSKTTLYDQLSISNLSICFGSTVALESKWFGVPCITVEQREESLIYAVDGEKIVKTEKLDDKLLYKLLNNNKREVEVENTNVAEFITSVLQH